MISRNYIFSALLLMMALRSYAADYPVSSIPKPLVKYANAVIRLREHEVEIHSINKVTIREHYVITILNEAGDNHAYWTEHYSKLNSVDRIEGTLYDAAGNKIRTLKKSEIKDEPVSSQMTMVDDNRVKYHNFFHREYPYTVEYQSTRTESQTMFLPNWSPVPSRGVSVEKSSFTLISDIDYQYRVKTYNYPSKSIQSTLRNKRLEKWEVMQVPAAPAEYASPPIHEIAPYVSFAPTSFRIDDFRGDMSSWKELGKFQYHLNKGMDVLPESDKQKVAEIVRGLNFDEEKVTAIYRYMQEKTHYVGIQLGIGGWRPFPAEMVSSKGYGDCKALSNYMVALLKEAGIKAYYTLIRGGEYERDIPADFPAQVFNHVVCAVPLKNDTIWLECTSQTVPSGYMGKFTGNRNALLITEDGGKLVRTPRYRQSDNLFHSNIMARLDASGNLEMDVMNNYQAECSDDLHGRIHAQSREEQQKYLDKNLDLPHYEIKDFSYKELQNKLPVIEERISLTAANYAQISGKRLFIIPNLLNKWNSKLAIDTARFYDIDLQETRIESDTVTIEVPAGYRAESFPKPLDLQTDFGRYQSAAELNGNIIRYTRRLKLNQGRFPAKSFNDLVRFYDQMYKADRARLVLVKSE
ncbi:DUF3857 domain-containing transglutaminase family protein [Flavihumibacter stibioxidans]|uniref:DUF3857 domain-containing protein n=1 Tax=Flavihumibacter stibioxidans TaxID=1834163 RepID=A0ABR7MDJ3_9BACT|nr:DUF3857 domain-containing protein [Flavihumibacter stibioxidans]MBC6493093.1 hypothetical protein [Flavihumibacter stibioxidans]